MITFLTTLIVFIIAVFALSLGWILNQKSIKGSCGGLNNISGMESQCSCSKPCEKRLKRMEVEQASKSDQQQQVINRLPD